jgi:segregation and condensation protein B
MSLKAKIEAVIYASEEPVTLAQLAGLLGQEAQQELDRLDARQQHLHLAERADDAAGDEPGAEPVVAADESAPQASAAVAAMAGADAGEPVQITDHAEQITSDPDAAAAPDGAAPDAVAADSAAEKRLARDRERKLREFLRDTVAELIADYASSDRGLEVREVAGGYRMATKPEYHDAVRGFVKSLKPALRLTLQALETLAVVAYKQPVTAPEITEIRGVDSGGVLGSLLARKLIATAGRKQVIGRPILYKTTKDFLLRFGLKDVNELPSMEEFERMAGELADAEPVQEEIQMSHHPESSAENEQASAEERITHENLQAEGHATAPQADGDSTPFEPFEPAMDDSNLAPGDLPTVDGRMSSLPPAELQPGEDPSADEAAIQDGEASESQ